MSNTVGVTGVSQNRQGKLGGVLTRDCSVPSPGGCRPQGPLRRGAAHPGSPARRAVGSPAWEALQRPPLPHPSHPFHHQAPRVLVRAAIPSLWTNAVISILTAARGTKAARVCPSACPPAAHSTAPEGLSKAPEAPASSPALPGATFPGLRSCTPWVPLTLSFPPPICQSLRVVDCL